MFTSSEITFFVGFLFVGFIGFFDIFDNRVSTVEFYMYRHVLLYFHTLTLLLLLGEERDKYEETNYDEEEFEEGTCSVSLLHLVSAIAVESKIMLVKKNLFSYCGFDFLSVFLVIGMYLYYFALNYLSKYSTANYT